MQENPEIKQIKEEELPKLIHVTFTPLELAALHNFFLLGYFHMLHEVSPECIEEYHTIFKGIKDIGPQLEPEAIYRLKNRLEKLCLAVTGVKDYLKK